MRSICENKQRGGRTIGKNNRNTIEKKQREDRWTGGGTLRNETCEPCSYQKMKQQEKNREKEKWPADPATVYE